ncbi:hypothetical protein BKH42_08825 [Helicobacter sp. 13S00482-2]|uniref:hypothetical protein n=1 Tax=Helicobacter sp. 13S00482-2 TaxID=1476200 RepID=UPI000BA716C7|nr:hypothetical protein [Helicobacter sp. 13S00482-2]PAF52915.1 hypothetical protein BKH42_08825 [Helicobacter sp. 13S00482-2]
MLQIDMGTAVAAVMLITPIIQVIAMILIFRKLNNTEDYFFSSLHECGLLAFFTTIIIAFISGIIIAFIVFSGLFKG